MKDLLYRELGAQDLDAILGFRDSKSDAVSRPEDNPINRVYTPDQFADHELEDQGEGEVSNLIERLRGEGADAMRKHLSLGMWALCSEAADEIERLQKILDSRPAINA